MCSTCKIVKDYVEVAQKSQVKSYPTKAVIDTKETEEVKHLKREILTL